MSHRHLRRQSLRWRRCSPRCAAPRLDDYVARYGQRPAVEPADDQGRRPGRGDRVRLANSQHLFYRKDILDKAGVRPPKSYEDELADAKIIKDKGIMQHTARGCRQAGLGSGSRVHQSLDLGTGADFLRFPETRPSSPSDNDNGLKTLQMMKDLTQYMPPDYLTYDADAMKAQYKRWQGRDVRWLGLGTPTP